MDGELALREEMRDDLRAAVTHIRAGRREGLTARGSAHFAWRRFVRAGLHIDEELFTQWCSRRGRQFPLSTFGATGDALIAAGVATREGSRAVVDPDLWRQFCQRATVPLPPFDAEAPENYEASRFIARRSRKARLALRKDDPRPVAVAERDPLSPYARAETLEAVKARARLKAPGGVMGSLPRAIPLGTASSIADDLEWLPFASPVTCQYWYWRWGTTKDRVRAAIGASAQWSMEAGKLGFQRLDDMDATRWAWRQPLPRNTSATYGEVVARTRDEGHPAWMHIAFARLMRQQLVTLMARALNAPHCHDDFSTFDYHMSKIRARARALIERGDAAPTVTTKQLFAWFAADAPDKGENNG